MKPRDINSVDNQRIAMRFNKVFPVIVGSEIYGECSGVARNVSRGGMLVEMADPLPLGSAVTIYFHMPDCAGAIIARAEVKHHYCFNYSIRSHAGRARGMGLRFIEFMSEAVDQFEESFTRDRVLH